MRDDDKYTTEPPDFDVHFDGERLIRTRNGRMYTDDECEAYYKEKCARFKTKY